MRDLLAQTGAVISREWALAFAAPTAGVFLAAFSGLAAVLAFELGGLFEAGEASLDTWFQFTPWLLCLFAPALAMAAFAGERREGSLEALRSLPLPLAALVAGKFLALWAIACLGLLSVVPLWIGLSFLGPVDHVATLATLLGAMLAAGAYVALSMAAGAQASNQVVAFVLAVLVCLVLTGLGLPAVAGFLTGLAGDGAAGSVRSLGLLAQFDGVRRGVLEAPTLVYLVTLTVAALLVTGIQLQERR